MNTHRGVIIHKAWGSGIVVFEQRIQSIYYRINRTLVLEFQKLVNKKNLEIPDETKLPFLCFS